MSVQDRAEAAIAELEEKQRQEREAAVDKARKEIGGDAVRTARTALGIDDVSPTEVVVENTGYPATGIALFELDGLSFRFERRREHSSYTYSSTSSVLLLLRTCPKCGVEATDRISFLHQLGSALRAEPHPEGCPTPDRAELREIPLLTPTPGDRLVELVREIAYDVVEESRQVES